MNQKWFDGLTAFDVWQVVKSYDDLETVNHEGVLEVGRLRSNTVQQLVTELISRMEINNNINTINAVWTYTLMVYIVFVVTIHVFYICCNFIYIPWCLIILYQGKYECKYIYNIWC